MDADWLRDVTRRADLHGVLSDPGRLAIVEMLTWGDRSPSDVAADLQMTSNLLAHHVNVLAEHGLVRRTRSEGDRRRTYLSLVPGALGGLRPLQRRPDRPARVLFVCTANSARSQLAAALWRAACDVPVASAGTHPAPAVAEGAVRAARRQRLPGLGSPHTLVEVHRPGDFVVTVCDRAHEETAGLADSHWSVPDPVRVGSDVAFDSALTELDRRVNQLLPLLTT
ncbi:helix-turn-helix domain-containing protein [Isoptericola sp. b441]|uniref:Helix-turn-helix domain-containing protein n=1 Tax=Actinotalea lenta TaxID=3064654 RepID=A0ABT9D7A9_9CELL|nr:ArsR family transcriptional regulator [Isoptericola sp. b441]MDO8106732.1 helix-turn-helix domain-containing protein [Isoptericola sp. b441]